MSERTIPIRPRRLRRLLAATAVGGVLAAAGLAIAAPDANATPVQDSAFLSALDSQGITYKSATAVITAGYAVCAMRDAGVPELGVADYVYRETALSAYDAGFFTGAAEAAYCPWHAAQSYERSEQARAPQGQRLV